MITPGKRLGFIVIAALLGAFLLSFSQSYAQIRVHIGMPDGSPFDLPDSGMVSMPVWLQTPGPMSAEIILVASYPITQWLGGYYYIDEPAYFSINDSLTLTMVFRAHDVPDTQFLLADLWFYINADPDDIGEQFACIERLYSDFRDNNGQRAYGTVSISPIHIVARTAVESDPVVPFRFTHSAYPNPFNSSVTISFTLPHDGEAAVTIYDISGRKVRSLGGGILKAGENSVVWDGADDGGVPLSSGIYFYRINCDNQGVTSKITLLR